MDEAHRQAVKRRHHRLRIEAGDDDQFGRAHTHDGSDDAPHHRLAADIEQKLVRTAHPRGEARRQNDGRDVGHSASKVAASAVSSAVSELPAVNTSTKGRASRMPRARGS